MVWIPFHFTSRRTVQYQSRGFILLQALSTITLAHTVHVQQSIARSVNLERDIALPAVADSYVLTGQALRSLHRIAEQINSAAPVRAWTLTGPYGSGKSLFGLFLMNLLCATNTSHAHATAQLGNVDAALAEKLKISAGLERSHGLLAVPVSGYRASLHECMQHGLRHALQGLSQHTAIQALLANKELWSKAVSSRTLIHTFEQILAITRQPDIGYGGLVLILDELGKPLEFSATCPEQGDIFLLQELAELAARSGETPLILIGILHQGFERYAGQLDTLSQREWAKVQGRFEDMPFQEPPNQQLLLLADALQTEQDSLSPALKSLLARNAAAAVEGNWRPPSFKPTDFEQLCLRAYPFHPTALVALPYIFRRLAQNDRSLFAYLTSLEPSGFQEFLNTHQGERLVRLPDLFDYLAINYQGRLYSSLRARPLTEALDRLETAPDLSPAGVACVKAIALLNWLADSGPFVASSAGLFFALSGDDFREEEIGEALHQLRAQSVIVLRRFNDAYAIWQGSDVDIDAQMELAQKRLAGVFSPAQAVQSYLHPQPIVARRHSYMKGATRFFELHYVDTVAEEALLVEPTTGACGVVLLCLSANEAETTGFIQWAESGALRGRMDVVLGVAQRTARLAEVLNELRCLHWVQDHTPELRDDPIARRELRTRINTVESAVHYELEAGLSLHQLVKANGCRWFWRGAEIGTAGISDGEMNSGKLRSISQLLSFVADRLFTGSPNLRNELINRRLLSSQGAAARRNLIEAMLSHSEQPQLAIAGFPPERSMYESLLRTSGLHGEGQEGIWRFVPPPADDPLQLAPVWLALTSTIFTDPPQMQGVEDLFQQLREPPFGMTDGVLPVLLCAFVLVHQDEVTIYREGTLLPEPGIADWEVLLRRPELFAVAGCRIDGTHAAIIQRLALGLQTRPAAMPVVRELIGRLKALPEHAWRTQRLTGSTLAARHALETARSPESLLFHKLPEALGLPTLTEDVAGDPAVVEHFFAQLNASLQEMQTVVPNLFANARDVLLMALGLPSGEAGWRQLLGLAAELAPTMRQPVLKTFLLRMVEAADERRALESVLAYVANRPPRQWTDADSDRFAAQAQEIGELWRTTAVHQSEEPLLSEAQTAQSRHLREAVHRQLRSDIAQDTAVVKAALRQLLRELETETGQR